MVKVKDGDGRLIMDASPTCGRDMDAKAGFAVCKTATA